MIFKFEIGDRVIFKKESHLTLYSEYEGIDSRLNLLTGYLVDDGIRYLVDEAIKGFIYKYSQNINDQVPIYVVSLDNGVMVYSGEQYMELDKQKIRNDKLNILGI